MTNGTWLARETEAVNLEWQHTVCMYLHHNMLLVSESIYGILRWNLVDCWKVLMSLIQLLLLFIPPVKSFSIKGTPFLQ